MSKYYFLRIIGLILYILSGISIALPANGNWPHPYSDRYTHHYNRSEYKNWQLPNSWLITQPVQSIYAKVKKRLALYQSKDPWNLLLNHSKKTDNQVTEIIKYQAKEAIVFDATQNILSLHQNSILDYEGKQLTADIISLHLHTHTITAKGKKDHHNQWTDNPIFTYKNVPKNKYGKPGYAQTQIFFMDQIHYNFDTKRALVDNLLANKEGSLLKSEQIKKEDEKTFYAKNIKFTTCALKNPHFYIRTRQAKFIEDEQITSGPFCLYFNDVPTPLGLFFGTLFLEGKRTYGVLPPELVENDTHGFGIQHGGYYVNFKDYADITMLGSIYADGSNELKNTLRYKKRYLCGGEMAYKHTATTTEQQGLKKGWAFEWNHATLSHHRRSFNANIALRNDGYTIFDKEEENLATRKSNMTSSGKVAYSQRLGFYSLATHAQYKKHLSKKTIHLELPVGTFNSQKWRPFQKIAKKDLWLRNLQFKHNINYENHFANNALFNTDTLNETPALDKTEKKWNHYNKNGIHQQLIMDLNYKAFKHFNLTPQFIYEEAWYGEKLCFVEGESTPIKKTGIQ